MAIQQECPLCKFRQALSNRKCKCGFELTKAKKQGKIRYFHTYRKRAGWKEKDGKQVPRYIQCKEFAGDSLTEALAVEGKRKAQKEEGILDKLPESKLTFNELTEWFLGLTSVKKLKYYQTLTYNLNSFNKVFGDTLINDVTPEDLKEYQILRKSSGLSDCYVDQHITAARTMLNRGFDNDKVSGDALKPF